jgi:hydrogenase maturation protease
VAGDAADALLIGYGNPLRGDDAIGWHVADAVRAHPRGSTVRVISAFQLTPELAEDVAGAARVVFVDAACDAPAGSVTASALALHGEPAVGHTQHQCHPATLLGLARSVYGTGPAAAWLLTIGASEFPCAERLSPAVRDAGPAAADLALSLLLGDAAAGDNP